MSKKEDVQRLPAEQLFQEEIDALIKAEKNPIPTGWKMSPKSVLTYICGGKVGKKTIIPKYIGNKRYSIRYQIYIFSYIHLTHKKIFIICPS